MGEAGVRRRRSHWARDDTGLRLCTLPSDRAHVYPACRTWSNTRWRCPPRGRSGCSGRLHPSSQPGQGALRLTDDQGRTAQNVPICVAYTASPRRRQSRPERRVRAGSPGQCPSLSVTSSIGITSRPTSDSAPLGQVCRRPIGHWSRFLSRQQHPAPAGTSCWSWRAICGI